MNRSCTVRLVSFTWIGLLLVAAGCGGGGDGKMTTMPPGDASATADTAPPPPRDAAGMAMLSIDPRTRNFGTVQTGMSAMAQTFTVTNAGTAASGTISTMLSGANMADFAITSNGCSGTLAPGANCTVTVNFSPMTAGAKAAALAVSATPGGSQMVMLSGTGAAPAALAISPMMQSFGTVVVGANSMAATFTVTNSGGVPSGAVNVMLAGTDTRDFEVMMNSCTGALMPMSNCTVQVRFVPTSAGAKSASITATASPGGTASAALSGSGVAQGMLSISPNPYRFPETVVGAKSAATTFRVTNGGGAPTGMLSTMVEGTDATQFAIGTDDCKGKTLMPNASCNITLQFVPMSAGDKMASLTVSGNPGGTVRSALTAKSVTDARLAIAPSIQSFGSVEVGKASTAVQFVVTNQGGLQTGALTVALGGADAAQFMIVSNSCNGQELAPAMSCALSIAFSPSAGGAKSATLTASGMPGGMAVAMLSGSGLAMGQISITPTMQDFGSVPVGASSMSFTFTVKNEGGAASGNIATALSGPDPTQFPIVQGGNGCQGISLAPGATCTISITFSPSATGAKMATLTVNASPGGSLTAALSGTGLQQPSLGISPTAQDFGSVGTGSSSSDVTFTVTNNGGSATGTLAAQITGLNADQFSIGNNGCTMALNAGASCMVVVRFAPSSQNMKSATLTVTGSPGGTASAPLVGTGVPPAALAISPTMQSFDNVLVGQKSAEITFTVTNNGAASTGMLAIVLEGMNATDFKIASHDCTTPLAQFASCMIKVQFEPAAVGSKVADLKVTGASGSVKSALTGKGVGPISIDPDTHDFGDTAAGVTIGPTKMFTVKNNNPIMGGASTGAITTSLLAGTPAQFKVEMDTCNGNNIAPQMTCTVVIRFTPQGALGAKTGSMTVSGAAGGSASVALTGNAVAALSISDGPTYDFGPTVIGTFAEKTFMVTNAMTAPTTTTISTALSGTDLGQFAIASDGCAGATLAGGASCSIKIRFIPSSTGAKSASIAASATLGGSSTVALTGTGTPAAMLTISPTSAAFGDVYAGSSSTDKTFTISNSTANSATGTVMFSVVGAGFQVSGGTCTSGVTALPGGQSCTITVKFSPTAGTAPGDKTGTLSVSASPGGMVTADLTAKVLAQLSIAPASKDFGNIVVGQSSTEATFTLKNDSPSAIPGTLSATLTGADSAEFSVPGASNNCASPPAPGATCTLTVKFSPATAGMKAATLNVTGTNVSVTAALAGTGIQDAKLQFTSSADVSFGSVTVGSTSTNSRTVTVINNGGVTSGAISHAIEGTNMNDFTVIAGGTCTSGTTTLAPGATCTYVLRFAPSDAGARAGTFKVTAAANTPGGTAGPINLGGNGAAAGAIIITPTPYDYGAVTAGTASNSVTFTVTNPGSQATGTLSAAVTGEYMIANGGTCSGTLAAGASCTYLVTFNPVGNPGDRFGTLDVSANPGGAASAALYGRARKDATVVVTPSVAYDFGQVTVAASSAEYTLTVRNDGDVTSGMVSATLGGTDPAKFSISSNNCTTLAAGATCTVKVKYLPPTGSAGQAHTADLVIAATPGGMTTIALSGNSVSAAALTVAPDTKDYGNQAVGSESTATDFSVSNAAGALTTGTLSFTLSNTADFRLDSASCPATLAGGANCVVKVYFKPGSLGAKTGTLTVSATPGGSVMASLMGTGIAALSIDSQTFVATAVGGTSAEVTFTVTNANGAPTTGILSTVLGGTDAAQFAVTGDTCAGATLAGAGTCTVKMKFVPTTTGNKTATLTVSGSPGNSATANLAATAN